MSWIVTLQPSTAFSTIKAEHTVIAKAMKGAIWSKGLLSELRAKAYHLRLFSKSQSFINEKSIMMCFITL